MMLIKYRRRDQKLDPDQKQEQGAGIVPDSLKAGESLVRQQNSHYREA